MVKRGNYGKAKGWESKGISIGTKRVKMKGLKSSENKYSQVIFNLSRTNIHEFKLEDVISNCQSYDPY